MRRTNVERDEACDRVRGQICASGDCRCNVDQIEVVVTSRKCLILIPHLGVRVEQKREDVAVRRVLRQLAAIRIQDALIRRSLFEDKSVVVRPHQQRGFVLQVPEDGIEVRAGNTQQFVDRLMSRLDQLMAGKPRLVLDRSRSVREQLMA